MPEWYIDTGSMRLDEILPRLHPSVRLLSLGLRATNRRHWRSGELDVDGLTADAEHKTGLHEWGDVEEFREALALLGTPRLDRASLTTVGKAAYREILYGRLVARLRVQDFLNKDLDVVLRPIVRPLFVVGLPRTGTSFLQRLLSLAPDCRPMLAWYGDAAGTALDPAHLQDDARARQADRRLRYLYRLAPGLATIHPTAACRPDEDLPLLMNTFMTDAFGLFADCDAYSLWLRQQGMAQAYRYYKLQLQILQQRLPEAYWVLKSPAHLPNLSALLAAFPDASIVHLHRDPVAVVSSTLSMRYKCLGALNRLVPERLPELVKASLDTLHWSTGQAIAVRGQIPAAQCLDVLYDDLVGDPVTVVRRIHDHFGYGWSAEIERRMDCGTRANRESLPQYTHSLAAFGLDSENVSKAFSAYGLLASVG